MRIRNFVISTILTMSPLMVSGQSVQFTPHEQQSISVETPGLFERATAFSVDFGQMKSGDFSFPLPVGKVDGIRKNNDLVISSKEGDAVKAMFAGTVRLSRNIGSWGNTIVIRHDNGLETMYANNAQNLVHVGDRVKAGQTIAIIGTKDSKTYCEFAIMVNGARMNPETIFDLSSHRLRRQTLLFQQHDKSVIIKVISEEREQTTKRAEGRRQPQRGNMTKDSHRTVQDESTASAKYKKDSEHIAQQQDDNAEFDIDEFQAIQLEEKVKKPTKTSNEFTVNFAGMKPTEWCYPMKGAHVISPFGGKRRHAGTDIKRQPGDPVFAAFDGQVVLSGTHYGYGLCVVIRHSNGFETLYSHQSKNSVRVGDWVKAGQQIGIVGRTGRATTEHCHFEMRCNGRPFDTSRVFDHAKNQLKKVILTYRNGKVYISNPGGAQGAAEMSEVATHSKSGGTSVRKKPTGKSSKGRSKGKAVKKKRR